MTGAVLAHRVVPVGAASAPALSGTQAVTTCARQNAVPSSSLSVRHTDCIPFRDRSRKLKTRAPLNTRACLLMWRRGPMRPDAD